MFTNRTESPTFGSRRPPPSGRDVLQFRGENFVNELFIKWVLLPFVPVPHPRRPSLHEIPRLHVSFPDEGHPLSLSRGVRGLRTASIPQPNNSWRDFGSQVQSFTLSLFCGRECTPSPTVLNPTILLSQDSVLKVKSPFTFVATVRGRWTLVRTVVLSTPLSSLPGPVAVEVWRVLHSRRIYLTVWTPTL